MKTFLAQNQFLSSSVDGSPPSPTDTAAAPAPGKGDAAAEPISVSPGELLDLYQRDGEIEPSVMLAWAPGENLPSSNEGRPEEASAPAPTKNPDADALGTEFIHEIFFYARRLMANYPGFVLDEARFIADIEELPMFLREDGYLKRQA